MHADLVGESMIEYVVDMTPYAIEGNDQFATMQLDTSKEGAEQSEMNQHNLRSLYGAGAPT